MKTRIGYVLVTGTVFAVLVYTVAWLVTEEMPRLDILLMSFGIGCVGNSLTQLTEFVVAGPATIRLRALLKDIRLAIDRLAKLDRLGADYAELRLIYEARVLTAMRTIREHVPKTDSAQRRLLDELLLIGGHQSMNAMPVATMAFHGLATRLGAEVIEESMP